MSALLTSVNICDTKLVSADCKFCLVDENKHPFRIDGMPCRPNHPEDFSDLESIIACDNLHDYAGIGISIQASDVQAIDVDHCFEQKFDISSADDRAKDILRRFKDFAYIEFSFSGQGMRVLFRQTEIDDYSKTYYIKNSSKQIEFYQPSQNARYVTITGRTIFDNNIETTKDYSDVVKTFLDDYMLRPVQTKRQINFVDDGKTIEELLKKVRNHYLTNFSFQNLWFSKAPGSGADESERDYHLVAFLYENITQDATKLKQIFEESPFYKSKDNKHLKKWTNDDFRYFRYLYGRIAGRN